jgi:hypothetical protein
MTHESANQFDTKKEKALNIYISASIVTFDRWNVYI